MRIRLVAFDSMGVRSMATFVETRDLRIFIDPSAALAPFRYGLPPHRLEIEVLKSALNEIETLIEKADVVVHTHYHYDHHDPGWRLNPEVLRDKVIILKDPSRIINVSQRIRAGRYLKVLSGLARSVVIGDGRSFSFGDTSLVFSEPVPHGQDGRLGYVLEVLVSDGNERMVFTSDVEGPCRDDQLGFVLSRDPDIVVLDGPPTYLVGSRYNSECLERSLANILRLAERPRTIVVDHHFFRDLGSPVILAELSARCRSRARLLSAAEFMGAEARLLEARRRELYEEEPYEPSPQPKHIAEEG